MRGWERVVGRVRRTGELRPAHPAGQHLTVDSRFPHRRTGGHPRRADRTPIRALGRRWHEQGYRAIIAVPLIAGTEVLGTLNGYYASVHTFTRYEIERLTLLASHAAIAVTSARRLDELRT